MSARDGYTRQRTFAEGVALTLQLAGHEDARSKPRRARRLPSAALAKEDSATAPDISGIPGVHLDARITTSDRWGAALDSAVLGASIANANALGAVVLYRRAHPVSRAIVAMTLKDFADLIAEREGLS